MVLQEANELVVLNLPRRRVIPSLAAANGVSPSLCLMPESPFECVLLKTLPSLPGRLTLLLPGGETSGLLSRSVWVAGLFPVCFLVLATMISKKRRVKPSGQPLKNPRGVSCAAPTDARIWSSNLPLYYLSDALTGSCLKSCETVPPGGCWAPLQWVWDRNHGNTNRERIFLFVVSDAK